MLRGGGFVGSAGGKDAIRCEDAKKQRCKASLKILGYYGSRALRIIFKISGNLNVWDAAATLPPHSNSLPKGARGQKDIPSLEGRGSKGEGENDNQPSPHPSPIGEGAICHPELCLTAFAEIYDFEHNVPMRAGSQEIQTPGSQPALDKMLKHGGQSDVQHDINISLKRTYRPNVLTSYRLKRKAAFTLAEVLITLGIIGVVAAITIPTLISNHQKEVVGKRLQKFYSTMQNAFNFAMIDHGEMSYWEFPTKQNDGDQMSKFATTYIFPYLKGVSQCDTNSNPECFAYGSEIFDQGLPAIYIFSDGSCFGMNIGGSGVGAGNIHIYYDYNCMQKPNIYGKDVFDFIIRWVNNEYVFKAGGYATVNKTTREELLNFCKNADGQDRGECSALIQFDGWQVKDDYPWL